MDMDERPPEEQGASFKFENIRDSVIAAAGSRIQIQEALSRADEARALEDFEREKLATGIARLQTAFAEPLPPTERWLGRPYKYLLPYDFEDTPIFFGRDEVVDRLYDRVACPDSSCRLAVLHGGAGMGKSSLLNAGLERMLAINGYFPIMVRLVSGSVPDQIKTQLIPGLNTAPILQSGSLLNFFTELGELLGKGRRTVVLLDNFDRFLESPEASGNFSAQLAECIFEENLDLHWVLSMRSGWLGYLRLLERDIPVAFLQNQFGLPPFSRAEARAAIEGPASLAGVTLEDGLADAILDDLGGEAFQPAQVQIVCQALMLETPGGNALSLADYARLDRAEGILENHLNRAIGSMASSIQENAWQVLAALSEAPEVGRTLEALSAELTAYGSDASDMAGLLRALADRSIVRRSGERYFLSSERMLAPIREWKVRRSVREETQAEMARQFLQLRNSAIRGVLAGYFGFGLSYLVANLSQDLFLLPVLAIIQGLGGALAGGVLVFADDIGRVSLLGRRRRLQWALTAVAGMVGFGLAMFFHEALELVIVPDMLKLLWAVIEGAGWGAATGLAIVWARTTKAPRWTALIGGSLLSATVLLGLDFLGQSFVRGELPENTVFYFGMVFLAGLILPLFLVGAAAWSPRKGSLAG